MGVEVLDFIYSEWLELIKNDWCTASMPKSTMLLGDLSIITILSKNLEKL